MKLTKLASLAMMAAFALGAFSAKATIIGTVTNYSKVSFSITVKTNKSSTTVGEVTKTAVGTTKFSNKNILSLLETANWANTTFPDGAQLVVGWDQEWDGAILVVDKTGTNVLYAATDTGSQEFYIDFFDEDGASTSVDNENDPGDFTQDGTDMYYFQLEDDSINLYIWGYPTGTHKFSDKWDADGNFTTWAESDSIDLSGGMGGDQELNDNSNGSVSGSIKVSGKGKDGVNWYWGD